MIHDINIDTYSIICAKKWETTSHKISLCLFYLSIDSVLRFSSGITSNDQMSDTENYARSFSESWAEFYGPINFTSSMSYNKITKDTYLSGVCTIFLNKFMVSIGVKKTAQKINSTQLLRGVLFVTWKFFSMCITRWCVRFTQ